MNDVNEILARALAGAMLQICPDALLIEGGKTRNGFFYDFVLSHQIHDHFLPILQDQMQGMLKKEAPFEIIEMVPFSASEYFKHVHQPYVASMALESTGGLLTLVKWGDFQDLCPIDETMTISGKVYLFDFAFPYAIKNKNVTRIFGSTSKPKRDRNKDVSRVFYSFDPQPKLAPKHQPLNCDWHGRGERLKRNILHFWELYVEARDFTIISSLQTYQKRFPEIKALAALQTEINENPNSLLGIFGLQSYTVDRLIISSTAEENYREMLLHFVKAWDIEFEENQGQIQWIDKWDRRLPGPYIQFQEKTKQMEISLLGPLEILVGLLIEKFSGLIPLWVSPESARIIPLSKEGEMKAESLRMKFLCEGVYTQVSKSKSPLKNQVKEIFLEKIPYVIVIGEKELSEGLFSLRFIENEDFELLSKGQLFQKLKKDYLEKVKF